MKENVHISVVPPVNRAESIVAKLTSDKRFWSYNVQKYSDISDELLIEKTLIYLDIEDINLLFASYPYKKIKQVWLQRLAIQGAYYARLNKFLAWMYFGIKNPERYLKTIEKNHLKQFQ